jgi:hypothetical protein
MIRALARIFQMRLGQLRFVIVTLVCLYETLVTQFPSLRTGDVNHHAWKVQQMSVDIRRMSKDELDALNESGEAMARPR